MPRPIPPDRLVSVYLLCDPTDGYAKYAGVATDPKRRLSVHCSPSERAKQNPKARWIAELAEKNLRPELLVIHEIPAGEADNHERATIALLRYFGFPLLNRQAGGRFYGSRA